MKTETIISRFKAKGYRVSKSTIGNVVITPANGFAKVFDSYAAAYRYYFN